jgi:hypothetical protein
MRWCSARQSGAVLVSAILAVTGCTAPASYGPSVTARTEAAAPVGNQGGSWEVVLPGGSTGPQLGAGTESVRNDLLLARMPEGIIQESYWPDARQDRLERLSRVFISADPRQVYFFRAGPSWPYRAYPQPYRGW